jgi:hypothetical protein
MEIKTQTPLLQASAAVVILGGLGSVAEMSMTLIIISGQVDTNRTGLETQGKGSIPGAYQIAQEDDVDVLLVLENWKLYQYGVISIVFLVISNISISRVRISIPNTKIGDDLLTCVLCSHVWSHTYILNTIRGVPAA